MQSSHPQTWPQRQGQQKSWSFGKALWELGMLRLATMLWRKKNVTQKIVSLQMVVVFKWWCDFPMVERKESPTKQIQVHKVFEIRLTFKLFETSKQTTTKREHFRAFIHSESTVSPTNKGRSPCWPCFNDPSLTLLVILAVNLWAKTL